MEMLEHERHNYGKANDTMSDFSKDPWMPDDVRNRIVAQNQLCDQVAQAVMTEKEAWLAKHMTNLLPPIVRRWRAEGDLQAVQNYMKAMKIRIEEWPDNQTRLYKGDVLIAACQFRIKPMEDNASN
jgi:hypothetical protein